MNTARPAAGTKKKNRNYGKHGIRGKNKISRLTSSVISATSVVVQKCSRDIIWKNISDVGSL